MTRGAFVGAMACHATGTIEGRLDSMRFPAPQICMIPGLAGRMARETSLFFMAEKTGVLILENHVAPMRFFPTGRVACGRRVQIQFKVTRLAVR